MMTSTLYCYLVSLIIIVIPQSYAFITGPSWPNEFVVEFNYTQLNGVPMSIGTINYDWSLKAERIDHTRCFCPKVGHAHECTAFFIKDSFIMYSKSQNICCKMQPFGPTAPTVYESWKYNSTLVLDDMATGYTSIKTQQWLSPQSIMPNGFIYYTTDDEKQEGIRLHDGRDGSEYTFGKFILKKPDPSIFDVNETKCFEPCDFEM